VDEFFLTGEFSSWQCSEDFRFKKISDEGDWELKVDSSLLKHGTLYKYHLKWPGGEGERISPYAERVVQDEKNHIFTSQVWNPEKKYKWKNPSISQSVKQNGNEGADASLDAPLIIYEAHIGMGTEEYCVGSFSDFEKNVLPRIISGGYTAVQFMALMEHPYYGSFGYQVSNFFALSSRFGTPEEFKSLVDSCHSSGIRVIMDIIHSHSVKNENEGISRFDGSIYQYFHEGGKGEHPAWDSMLFDYGKPAVLHFLLSNCRYWIEEYKIDGFRFDGVTSMIYHNHGLESSFSSYDDYYSENTDIDALTYLALANKLLHSLKPGFISISEDMSGYPGMAFPVEKGGIGFDYRLGMGIPDFWIKLIKEKRDEDWNIKEIWHQLGNRRWSEKNIAYSESHDQALVGDKTIAFRLMDADMYHHMAIEDDSLTISRGMALHKIIRLLTFSCAGNGYMNFMGNEFGHPEWVDFPRKGNNWSYHYARRQWSLSDNKKLKYKKLLNFDSSMIRECNSSLDKGYASLLQIHVSDHVIAYTRGGLFYFVNLDPDRSYTDYRFNVPDGNYSLVLDTDSIVFGGYGRNPEHLEFEAGKNGDGSYLSLYLPSRTALVFRKMR
jgi:1,4-alpha-glucan branching enzyme